MKLSDYVVSFIENLGVDAVFLLSGGGSIHLCDSFGKSKKIKYFACHHEQAAAMATEAYARVSGKIGVSLVTSGPGGTNAITGVAGSWMDSVPHLVLSGQVHSSQTIAHTGTRQIGVQEINIIDMIMPITKYAVIITDPQTIRYHLEKAVYLATTGRFGPVWLDIPANVQLAQIDEHSLKVFTPEEHTLPISQNTMSSIAQLLKNAQRPLIHVGQGIRHAHAEEQLLNIAETYNIPFVTARNANDIFPSKHPLNIGRPGTWAHRAANFAVQNADVYIAVGTRLSMSTTGYNGKDFARNAIKIMVDIDESELNKPTLSIDYKIHADAKVFLDELDNHLQGTSLRTAEWINQCNAWKEKYPVVLPEFREQKEFVNVYHFVDVLSDLCTKDDIVVTDMGLAFQVTHQAFKVKQGQRMFTNSGLAAMGWGLPAAVGACIGGHLRRTICMNGDGGIMLNLQELQTISHNKLPVKIILYNNAGYLTIRQTQEYGFEGRYVGSHEQSGVDFPDFELLAKSFHLPYTKITTHTELVEKLQSVLDQPGPSFCEVMVDQNQLQHHRALSKRKEDGTMEPRPFEDLFPFIDRKEFKENMIAERKGV